MYFAFRLMADSLPIPYSRRTEAKLTTAIQTPKIISAHIPDMVIPACNAAADSGSVLIEGTNGTATTPSNARNQTANRTRDPCRLKAFNPSPARNTIANPTGIEFNARSAISSIIPCDNIIVPRRAPTFFVIASALQDRVHGPQECSKPAARENP